MVLEIKDGHLEDFDPIYFKIDHWRWGRGIGLLQGSNEWSEEECRVASDAPLYRQMGKGVAATAGQGVKRCLLQIS